MPEEENRPKAIVLAYLEELIGGGQIELAETLCHRDIVFHDPLGEIKGHEGVVGAIARFRAAFPDLTYQVQRIIAEGELVAAQTVISGTHLGEFMGISATGRKFELKAMQMFLITEEKIKEGWAVGDVGAIFEQVGIERPSSEKLVD